MTELKEEDMSIVYPGQVPQIGLLASVKGEKPKLFCSDGMLVTHHLVRS